MIYSTVPEKAKVEILSDIKEFTKLQKLLVKHGYAITFFGKNGVSFYKTSDTKIHDGNRAVPVSSRYHFDRKDFSLFVEIILKLDSAERKMIDSVVHSLSGPLQMRG